MGVKATCQQVIQTMELLEPAVSSKPTTSGRGTFSDIDIDEELLDSRISLKATLVSWAKLISEEGGQDITCADTITSITRWIESNAPFLDAHPAADDFHAEVHDKLHEIHQHLNPPDRIYCGYHNGKHVYAPRGAVMVRLPDGSWHTVTEMQKHLRRKIEDEPLTADQAARALSFLDGMDVTPDYIRKLARRDEQRRSLNRIGKTDGLRPIRIDGGIKLYLLQEVRDRLAAGKSRRGSKVVLSS